MATLWHGDSTKLVVNLDDTARCVLTDCRAPRTLNGSRAAGNTSSTCHSRHGKSERPAGSLRQPDEREAEESHKPVAVTLLNHPLQHEIGNSIEGDHRHADGEEHEAGEDPVEVGSSERSC